MPPTLNGFLHHLVFAACFKFFAPSEFIDLASMSKVGEKSTSRFGKLNTPKLGKKITQQVFKTKLAFVDVDIEREWPELCGAGIQEGLYNEVVRTRGLPVSHLVNPNLTVCESED